MSMEIGTQNAQDTLFKAIARLHQSHFRAEVLALPYHKYGNILPDDHARNLHNYYDKLGVRDVLRSRYPEYLERRDADMLRSDHMPYNLFAPLLTDRPKAAKILAQAFDIPCKELTALKFDYSPTPPLKYLDDQTAYDVFVQYLDAGSNLCGLGISVKYSEQEYQLGPAEKRKVENLHSAYWKATRESGAFINPDSKDLASNNLRHLWKNHLLGIQMVRQRNVTKMTTITLFPAGNEHFRNALPAYQDLLIEKHRPMVRGCTFETYIAAISGSKPFDAWREYLDKRYVM